MNTEFSVLMSVYVNDSAENLEQSIYSVTHQSLLPKEIILVQDGQLTENLNKKITFLLKKFSILKLVALPKNVGLGYALLEGTKYVTTNLIARMDADDISVTNRFEKQLREFNINPEISIVGGQVAEFENNVSNVVSYRYVPLHDSEIRQFAKFRSPFNHPTVMIKKDILIKVGGYLPFDYLEDYYLWIRLLSEDNVYVSNISDILVYMRVDQGMYGRRGGLKYLKSYVRLKKISHKNNFINYREYLLTIVPMLCSTIMPIKLRKILYKLVLRKK
ncbi:glycosyltransferase [Leuconostoc citreum]|uniref:glycosyltransferase n=1 Tax=Leuconostoc citreum TaxID=33964 RepID=UPI00065FE8E7|nr:glycosyltransferase [Leuconostoc citreum]KAF0261004.1 glycosyl transferase [Leuconostoc citreum]MCT3068575.1 glycosyltransferase [Leuconostoc citreum]QEA55460.1 glycosyltransferase [Leuconostoc citreum]